MILTFNERFSLRFKYHPYEFRFFVSIKDLEDYYRFNLFPKKQKPSNISTITENFFLYLGKKYVVFENDIVICENNKNIPERYFHKYYKLLFNGNCIYARSDYFDNENL
jgi:hypothetical protein